jgi:putative methyltransferase (TIGR04325 family)
LKFNETIEECFSNQPVNVVLFSSVLQYVENPYEFLKMVVRLKPTAIIIDRTPLASVGERNVVQSVRAIFIQQAIHVDL